MKKLTIILSIFLFTSCGWFNFGTTDFDHISGFQFLDEQGNDLFADSLDIKDFHLSSLKGSANKGHIDSTVRVTTISIHLVPEDNEMLALFHFKEDVDTVTAYYTKDDHSITNVVYNGVTLESWSSTGRLFKIYK